MWSDILTLVWVSATVGVATYIWGCRNGHSMGVRDLAQATKEDDRDARLSAGGVPLGADGVPVQCVGWLAVVVQAAHASPDAAAGGAPTSEPLEHEAAQHVRALKRAVELQWLEAWWNGPTKDETT